MRITLGARFSHFLQQSAPIVPDILERSILLRVSATRLPGLRAGGIPAFYQQLPVPEPEPAP